MTALQLTPVTLSLLVLAAHFLRAGRMTLVAVTLLLMALYAVRRPLAARILQAALILGAIEWIRTLITVASLRMRVGEPWTRLAVILGAVTAVTLASALLLNTQTLRHWYRRT
jgi:hypothetical protein